MNEKTKNKISLSTFFLMFAILIIALMAYFTYKIYNDKQNANNEITELNSKINNLQATIEILKEEKVTSEENSNDEKIDATTKTEVTTKTDNVNKRLYKLYNNQRYILLMDDNKYDLEENFLNKKTYILDLNMKDSSEIVKEIDLSSKLKPFVDNYINENKGTTKGEYTIEYFDVEDLLTPLDIDDDTEVAFKVYYRCINGNTETSLGSEYYAYNVQTDQIRDLGKAN